MNSGFAKIKALSVFPYRSSNEPFLSGHVVNGPLDIDLIPIAFVCSNIGCCGNDFGGASWINQISESPGTAGRPLGVLMYPGSGLTLPIIFPRGTIPNSG
jgi:hypothetical protein